MVPLDNWSPWKIGPPGQLVPLDNWSPWTIGPQNLLVYSKSGLEPFFKFFDIGWSTLDIMNDFKPISKKKYLHFGEINQSLLFVFVKKHYLFLFSIRNGIFRQKII
jgi:hypothetical protein